MSEPGFERGTVQRELFFGPFWLLKDLEIEARAVCGL